MEHFDVLTIGETLVDAIAAEKGKSLAQTQRFDRHLGGSVANIACAVALMGGRAGIISQVGEDDAGRMCRSQLRQAGVDVSALHLTPTLATTHAYVSRTEGTPEFRIERGADASLRLNAQDAQCIAQTRIIHASTFALSVEPLRSAVIEALTLGYYAGKIVSLDPNYHPHVWPNIQEARSVLARLYPLVAITKPSLDDATRLFGTGRSNMEYMQCFLDMGAKLVVLTTGPDDVYIADQQGYRAHVPVPRVPVTDVTGAGDWFWAAFMLAHLDGFPPVQAVRFAIAVAHYKIGFVGPLLAPIDRKKLYDTLCFTPPNQNIAH